MKRKQNIFFAFVIAILALLVVYSFFISLPNKTTIRPPLSTTTEESGFPSTPSPVIPTDEGIAPEFSLDNLHPGDTLTSPTTLRGYARGWYFEGSFPVKLLDGNGAVMWQGPAQALSD